MLKSRKHHRKFLVLEKGKAESYLFKMISFQKSSEFMKI